jgi:hypothetical protein
VCHVLTLAISAPFRSRAQLIAENVCLRQQLIGAAAQVPSAAPPQRRPARLDLREPVVRQLAQLAPYCEARDGVTVASTGKYIDSRHDRSPSPGWRQFLKRHDSNILACDFFSVQTISFETLYVFFVIRHVNRQNPTYCRNIVSDGRLRCPANSRMLCLRSMAASISDSRSRRSLPREIRLPNASPRESSKCGRLSGHPERTQSRRDGSNRHGWIGIEIGRAPL